MPLSPFICEPWVESRVREIPLSTGLRALRRYRSNPRQHRASGGPPHGVFRHQTNIYHKGRKREQSVLCFLCSTGECTISILPSLLQNSLGSGIYCREELLSLGARASRPHKTWQGRGDWLHRVGRFTRRLTLEQRLDKYAGGTPALPGGNPWLARCRSLSRALFCRSILPPSHARLRILQKALPPENSLFMSTVLSRIVISLISPISSRIASSPGTKVLMAIRYSCWYLNSSHFQNAASTPGNSP